MAENVLFKLLGINTIELQQKISDFYDVMDNHNYAGGDVENLIKMLDESFTANELKLMALKFLEMERRRIIQANAKANYDMIMSGAYKYQDKDDRF